MTVNKSYWGNIDAQTVSKFTLQCDSGISMVMSDYGARILELWIPSASGEMADIVLGYDLPESYRQSTSYMGGTIGRYANRIRNSRFELNGASYSLANNEGAHCLHGGPKGFDQRVWSSSFDPSSSQLRFQLVSDDGDQGFPAQLIAEATYTLESSGILRIEIQAQADAPTVCNLTNHSYFNLAGHASGSILNHQLEILADFYTPTDAQKVITGEVLRVADTAFDFTHKRAIGGDVFPQDGYDQNWCLRGRSTELKLAARLEDPVSGRAFDLLTTEPGLQLYTGKYLEADISAKQGYHYQPFAGLALEAQRFPDAPNLAHLPDAWLNPGETYIHKTELRFRI